MNILFIGNSFTMFNDMTTTVQKMCDLAGKEANVVQVAHGGYTLSKYLGGDQNATSELLEKLNTTKWDYVILQEFSNGPLVNKERFIDSVIELNKLIKENGAKTLLYSTWSYRDDSDKLKNEAGVSYDEFYSILRDRYDEAGKLVNAHVVQVGTAFYNVRNEFKELDLLLEDDFHPSPDGSYVVASLFYLTIFGGKVIPDYIPVGVSKQHIEVLKENVLRVL